MRISRRGLLLTAATLPLAVQGWRHGAQAQTGQPSPGKAAPGQAPLGPTELPPILFVHGNQQIEVLKVLRLDAARTQS